MFRRLVAVHERKPKERRTFEYQNPNASSRAKTSRRIMEENQVGGLAVLVLLC